MAAHHGVSSSLPSLLFFTMTVSVAVLVLVQPSVAVCNRYRRNAKQCGSYVNYFNAYDSQVDQHYKVLDGVEAQISYINLANSGELKKLFKPGNRDEREIIKSLIELNLMREKIQEMGDLGQHTSIIATLLSYAAEDACRYLEEKFGINNCTDNQVLEQLKYRLEFIKAIDAAKVLIKESITGIDTSLEPDYCAWMNDRALDCQDPSTRSSNKYASLNAICTRYPLCPGPQAA